MTGKILSYSSDGVGEANTIVGYIEDGAIPVQEGYSKRDLATARARFDCQFT